MGIPARPHDDLLLHITVRDRLAARSVAIPAPRWWWLLQRLAAQLTSCYWILVILAAGTVGSATAPAVAVENSDSGWAVASSPGDAPARWPVDNRQRLLLEQVLGQSAQPPSWSPDRDSAPVSTPHISVAEANVENLRVTRRPGWNPFRGMSNSEPKEQIRPAPPLSGPMPSAPTDTSPSFLLQTTNQNNKSRSQKVSRETVRNVRSDANEEELDIDEDADDATDVVLQGDEPETSKPLPSLTRELVVLRTRVRKVLKGYYRKPLNSRDNDSWEVMHGMLAFGIHSRVRLRGPQGEPVTAVGWLCYNKPCKWTELMYVNRQGEVRAKYGVGLQGHMGQFLAMLAQCGIERDYPIRVDNRQFTVEDLIKAEMDTCYPKQELTFKLIALMHYLDSDTTWLNDQGSEWSIERLIREEMDQPIRGAACGGTHRLSGLTLAARTRVERGEPLDGDFAKAAKYVEKYQEYAFRLQNRDGSLSTQWFRGRGDEPDIDRRIKTTGHILEWLCYSLNDEELADWRTYQAVNYLTVLLYQNYNHEWETGPLCHALHALVLYDERMFQPYDEVLDVAARQMRREAMRGRLPAEAGTWR